MDKLGRPKSDNPKNIRINLRLTKEEHESMLYVADQLQLSLSEAIVVTMEERADDLWRALGGSETLDCVPPYR